MSSARISRVLVGVDFDEASAAALKMAGVLAAAWHAGVTLLHSARQEAPAYFTAAQIEALEAEREQSRARTVDQLRALAEPHLTAAAGVVVDEGPPQDAMLRMAASFDLLVVGTHQRHGARRWWLGSVAEAVVRRSPRPVLVVPAGAAVPDTRRALTILAAGDDTEANRWVDVFKSTFGGEVVRSLNIHECTPDRLQKADLIVVPLPSGTNAHERFGTIVQMLKECVHPVLFVPSAGGLSERRAS